MMAYGVRTQNPWDRHIGARVRARRIAVGISQSKLGQEVGITFQQVQKYEKGTNRISSGRLLQFARILGVDVGYFFEGAPGGNDVGVSAREIKEADAIRSMVSSKEGVAVLRALGSIKRPKLRHMIVEFAERLAAEGL
jgi:transcriptional regulator with XRE-family HTH domain